MTQLFAKIFSRIFDSSLADDWKTRVVFQDLLILADEKGVVDMTPDAIARRTNLPPKMVLDAIPKLESEDKTSRTADHGGRRILRLDAHRDWGWRIANFQRYRESATKEMLRMAETERKRAYRDKLRAGARESSNAHTPSPKPPTSEDKEKEGEKSLDLSGTNPQISTAERITCDRSLTRVQKQLEGLKGSDLLPAAQKKRDDLRYEEARLKRILGVKF